MYQSTEEQRERRARIITPMAYVLMDCVTSIRASDYFGMESSYIKALS
jgi:hypothetical protein